MAWTLPSDHTEYQASVTAVSPCISLLSYDDPPPDISDRIIIEGASGSSPELGDLGAHGQPELPRVPRFHLPNLAPGTRSRMCWETTALSRAAQGRKNNCVIKEI
ncbi:Dna-Dependent Protein Kinase Catalytic Subunit [Manis pentadactyla]|nr:Dna-Dependent Protein Kinase Catalytic Subunit [Manis pentadactyla]